MIKLRILGPDLQNILRFIVRYIVRLTYDNDLRHAKIYLTIIVS